LVVIQQDQGNPPRTSETTLFVNVVDADDQNPRFFDDRYMAVLPDRPVQVRFANVLSETMICFTEISLLKKRN
jgi:hypothetical protein